MALCVERSLVSPRWPARWQLLLHRWRSGWRIPCAPGCSAGEVGVLAKLRDLKPLRGSADFRMGSIVGQTADGAWLLTGRAPIGRIERLLADAGTCALEPAVPLSPLLDDATLELAAQRALLPSSAAEQLGAGAVIGIVDSALDCGHDSLRDASGRPRIIASWQQAARARRDDRASYGAIWDRRELWLSVDGHGKRCAQHESHAARMLDMAAGNGNYGAPGVAPRADIVHVDLSTGCSARLGDTVRFIEGVGFVFDVAQGAACAVNVSLGGNAGPHDGSSLVEQALDLLATSAPNRAILVAAGNSYAAEQHAAGSLAAGETCELQWYVPSRARARHGVEIWFTAGQHVELELAAPRRQGRCRVRAGDSRRLVDESSGKTVALACHERSTNGDTRVASVFLERGAPAGVWSVILRHRGGDAGGVHAWIVPEDSVRPVFLNLADTSCTLNALACGRHTVSVGAYDAGRPHLPLAWFTSAGPTRDGRPKPDVSAPGHRVWVAAANRRESSVECSGTSLAAAAATGVAALVLARASALGISLNTAELAEILISSVRRHPPGSAWHDRYGHGRLDAATAIAALEERCAARYS